MSIWLYSTLKLNSHDWFCYPQKEYLRNFYDYTECGLTLKLANSLISLINIIVFHWWYSEISTSFGLRKCGFKFSCCHSQESFSFREQKPVQTSFSRKEDLWEIHEGIFQNPSTRTVAGLETVLSKVTLHLRRSKLSLLFPPLLLLLLPSVSFPPFLLYCEHALPSPGLNIPYLSIQQKRTWFFSVVISSFWEKIWLAQLRSGRCCLSIQF